MESFEGKVRLKVIFGKFPVVAVDQGYLGVRFTLQMPGGKIISDLAVQADVRVGDLLTVYTEVLADDKPRAKPIH
jgi:hypothetical protein